ncbi:anti-sigma factor [Rhizobium halophytocola]|uniref:Anti-sigma-K factor RskA n=1 Tax=Rhizobium halophytocola TaxID=735519 RepID=A0ABS4E061_9HYPH|nr:anti-sigma factor [Rhizobium halophytocola]MBP1851331.1 anti-sigma-K factor RskA [Rhizobium halophytocola]
MTTPNRSKADRSRDEVLAGEYVLGALDARARRSAKARMRRDRQFAAMVDRWEENLADYDLTLPDVSPADYATPRALALQQQPPVEGRWKATWNSVSFWRGLATASIFGFTTFLVFYLSPGIGQQPRPLTAEMTAQTRDMTLQAHYDHRTAMLHVVPVATGQAAERSLQLWLIDGDAPPRSLGLLDGGREASVLVPTSLRNSLRAGATFAVSIEPLGGSPSGQATGPLVAMGAAHF